MTIHIKPDVEVYSDINFFCDDLYLCENLAEALELLKVSIRSLFDVTHVSLIYGNQNDLWHIEKIIGDLQSFHSFDDVLDSRAGYVIETGNSQLFDANDDLYPVSFEPYESIFPLIDRNEYVFGCIVFGRSDPFDEETIASQAVFARRLARVVMHMSRYEAIHRKNRQMENQVKNMTLQLQELDAYNHTVAHDLRTPLSVISLKSNLLGVMEDLSPKSKQHLLDIRSGVMGMSEMIDQLITLTRIRNEVNTLVMVNTQMSIQNAMQTLDVFENGQLTVQVASNLPVVLGHIDWIDELFINLFKYMIKQIQPDTETPAIHIRADKQKHEVCFRVESSHLDIPEEQVRQMFQRFNDGKYSKVQGFKLELAIVHRIVTQLGSDLDVFSTPDGKMAFTFKLFSR